MRDWKINLNWLFPLLVILAIVLFFGSCAWSANHAPRLAFIASGVLFVFLGWATRRMGSDGRNLQRTSAPTYLIPAMPSRTRARGVDHEIQGSVEPACGYADPSTAGHHSSPHHLRQFLSDVTE